MGVDDCLLDNSTLDQVALLRNSFLSMHKVAKLFNIERCSIALKFLVLHAMVLFTVMFSCYLILFFGKHTPIYVWKSYRRRNNHIKGFIKTDDHTAAVGGTGLLSTHCLFSCWQARAIVTETKMAVEVYKSKMGSLRSAAAASGMNPSTLYLLSCGQLSSDARVGAKATLSHTAEKIKAQEKRRQHWKTKSDHVRL